MYLLLHAVPLPPLYPVPEQVYWYELGHTQLKHLLPHPVVATWLAVLGLVQLDDNEPLLHVFEQLLQVYRTVPQQSVHEEATPYEHDDEEVTPPEHEVLPAHALQV